MLRKTEGILNFYTLVQLQIGQSVFAETDLVDATVEEQIGWGVCGLIMYIKRCYICAHKNKWQNMIF